MLAWVVRGDPGREQRAKHQQAHEQQAGERAFVAREGVPEFFQWRRVEQALVERRGGRRHRRASRAPLPRRVDDAVFIHQLCRVMVDG
ncbi:hypothetical protein FQZ97_1008220 [compost metagenome]